MYEMGTKRKPHPSRVRGRGVEVSKTLFYSNNKVYGYIKIEHEFDKKKCLTPVSFYDNLSEVIENGRKSGAGVSL
jgi:hypothetical protein